MLGVFNKYSVKLESRPSKINVTTFITLFIEPTGYFLCAEAKHFKLVLTILA